MEDSEFDHQNFNVLVKEEILSYGEVFVVEIKHDHLFEWWISCNICKDIFHSIEKFLDHTTNMHFNQQSNEIVEIERADFFNETANNINVDDKKVDVALSIVNTDHNYIYINSDENNIDCERESEMSCVYIEDSADDLDIKSDFENSFEIIEDQSELNDETNSIPNLDYKENFNQKLRENIGKKVKKRLPCPHCDKTYTTRQRQKEHIAVHLGLNPIIKCKECGSIFASKTNLRYHMRIHTGERPLKCSFCAKTFRARPAFAAHLLIHTGEKKFACSFCGKRIRTKAGWRLHERTHTGEKPFQCDKCGAWLQTKSSLKGHMRIHTGERPFKCSVCHQKFRTKPPLVAHMMTHTGEKKFSCSFCGKHIRTKAAWRTHERTHTEEKASSSVLNNQNIKHKKSLDPIPCDMSAKSNLEKKFKCEICAATFGSKKSLKQHERIHSKSKDYNCKICSEGFLTYDSIRYHMNKKHECALVPNCNYSLKGRTG